MSEQEIKDLRFERDQLDGAIEIAKHMTQVTGKTWKIISRDDWNTWQVTD